MLYRYIRNRISFFLSRESSVKDLFGLGTVLVTVNRNGVARLDLVEKQDWDRKDCFASPGLRITKIALSSEDRKSTRLNSSHVEISYAVFCLKKKKKKKKIKRKRKKIKKIKKINKHTINRQKTKCKQKLLSTYKKTTLM